MDKLRSMEVFQQVAKHKSFVRAAEDLDLSPAMVSRYVSQLEAHLKVRLLHRNSRNVSLTQDGQIYLERLTEILNDLEETEALLSHTHQKPSGVLRISAPVWLCQRDFMEALAKYRELYPEVQIDLQVSDSLMDLTEARYDLALRVTQEPQESLFARELTPIPFYFVASQRYLSEVGHPQSLHELAKHGLLMNSAVIRNHQTLKVFENGKAILIPINPNFQCNNTVLLAHAAVAGLGIILLPSLMLNHPDFEHTLRILLPETELPFHPKLYAVYTSKQWQSPKVRTFIDFMVKSYQHELAPKKQLKQ